MPWQCRLIEPHGELSPGRTPEPGDMWFAPHMIEGEHREWYLSTILSAEYVQDWLGKRPPIMVCLPDRSWFNVDQRADGAGEHGWMVTGEAPNITVSPSINAVGRYHGWLHNGVISDDVEGRVFK